MLRFDPRTTLLLVMAISVAVFIIADAGLFWLVGGAVLYLLAAGFWRLAVVDLVIFALLWVTQYVLVEFAPPPVAVVGFMLFFGARLMPVAMIVQVLAKTSPGAVIAALKKMRVPQVVVLPCAIMLRFIPTINNELSAIRDGMRLRGLGLGSMRWLTHPILFVESLYVPLMIRSMTVADHLAVSAATRGVDNPGPRTSLRRLNFGTVDVLAWIGAVIFISLAIVLGGAR